MDKPNSEKPQKKEETPLNPPFPKGEEKGIWSALSLAWELGYTIAVPIVVFALLGRLIDNWLKTGPWFLLLGIFASIVASSFAVYFKTVRILNESAPSPSPSPIKGEELEK